MDKLTKDRECIKCKHFFDCTGKPRGSNCIKFQERKEEKHVNLLH